MEESISKFVTAILAIVIMFIFPVYIAYEKKDDISYALAVRYTQEFVDKVRSKGYITRELYQDYASKLLTTGNTYNIELEHRYVRFDPDGASSGTNVTAVRNEEVYSTEHILNFMDNNEEHKYVMNVNDNFNVKITNTNVTMATVIYNIVTVNMSSNNARIYVDYGGKVLADKWWGNIDFFPGEEGVDYTAELPKLDKYTVTNSLVNVTNTNNATSIEPDASYSATLKANAGYTLDEVTIQVRGEDVTSSVYNRSTGEITINPVTGNIYISAKAIVKGYSISKNLTYVTSSDSVESVQKNGSYSTTLKANTGYTMDSVKVKMGGTDITSTAYNTSTGKITISEVTGNIVITATAKANTYTVTLNLTNVTGTSTASSVTHGNTYTTKLTAKTGYTIDTVKVTMGGKDITSTYYNTSTGKITISSVTGNIVITAKAKKAQNTISQNTSFIGYYADVDGDGTVDGVIFADLAFSKSGTWNPSGSTEDYAIKGGAWSYNAVSNTKDYVISQTSYAGKFGTKPVIKLADNSTGNDRFYVMALTKFETTSSSNFYWYENRGYISDYSEVASLKFGTGKTNTDNMINAWNNERYGSQDSLDIWGLIQNEVAKGWFIPSINEWAAFGSAFNISNNNTCGLSVSIWSSSMDSNNTIYLMAIYANKADICGSGVITAHLATTF